MLDAANEPRLRDGLLSFRRLDLLLATAVAAARLRFGPEAAADAFRGLYLTAEQVERALATPAGQPLVGSAPAVVPDTVPPPSWAELVDDNPRWEWLRDTHELSDIELDVVLLALGPDVDRRYEQLYGFLQDDVSLRRPTVSLALDLLTNTPRDRLHALEVFGAEAPLVRHRLISLRADGDGVPLIAHRIALDDQITAALLQLDSLDRRLATFCRTILPFRDPSDHLRDDTPDSVPRTDELQRDSTGDRLGALTSLTRQAWGRHPLRLCFSGPPGSGRLRTAARIGERLQLPVLVVATPAMAADGANPAERLALVFREATLRGCLVYLDDADCLLPESAGPGRQALTRALHSFEGVVVLGTREPWAPWAQEPLGVLDVPFSLPPAHRRRTLWRRAVASAGADPDAVDVRALGDRFRLSSSQIADATRTAAVAARLRVAGADTSANDDAHADGGGSAPTPIATADLFAAARSQSGHQLSAFARRVPVTYGWDDLVLPADVMDQLRELVARVEHRARVMDEWGFDAKLSGGKGISALFAGPPGTGKTMAAQVIAGALGLDLFAIDLSAVVSKYIGETEKNLERVFRAAADSDAILFFDEADALFGKRSEVHDSHDRYANMEIAYLLQRMEQYDGLAILATNLRGHLDEAFTRRLQAIVEFPFPDVAERRRIWQACLPRQTPLSPDVDLDAMAHHRLAGGNIKNVVLGAAFLAAARGLPVGREHLLEATRREHQKMGKVVVDAEPDRLPDPPPDP
jgi:AAA+ superfamily predicted ATPase